MSLLLFVSGGWRSVRINCVAFTFCTVSITVVGSMALVISRMKLLGFLKGHTVTGTKEDNGSEGSSEDGEDFHELKRC